MTQHDKPWRDWSPGDGVEIGRRVTHREDYGTSMREHSAALLERIATQEWLDARDSTELREALDARALIPSIARVHSSERTEETPCEDPIWGGYCESDAQLRARIKEGLHTPYEPKPGKDLGPPAVTVREGVDVEKLRERIKRGLAGK
jgi:hypothetical protein